MRKQLRKALSMVLSAAMVVALGSGVDYKAVGAADAATPNFQAKLNVKTSENWNAEASKTVTVNKNGTYELTVAPTASGTALHPQYVDVTIPGLCKTVEASKVTISDVKLSVDGSETVLENGDGKAWWGEIGDWSTGSFVQTDGDYKLELVHKDNQRYEKFYNDTWSNEIKVTFTINVEGLWSNTETENPNPSGTTSGSGTTTSGTGTTTSGTGTTTSGGGTEIPDTKYPEEGFAIEMGICDAETDQEKVSQYWGAGNEKNSEGIKVESSGPVKADGAYKVSADFRGLEKGGLDGLKVLTVELKNTEDIFPDNIIRVDNIRINGTDMVGDDVLKKICTVSENKDARANLYNAWSALNESKRVDTGMTTLDDADILALEEYEEELIETVEVSFTYGSQKFMDSNFFAGDNNKRASIGTATFDPEIGNEAGAEFESGISFVADGWGSQYWGAGDCEIGTAYNAEVTGNGQYKVGIDFRTSDKGYVSGLEFSALMINGIEGIFPSNVIRLDAMKVNGKSIDAKVLDRAYTTSDDCHNTRVNLYNGWVETSGADIKDPYTKEVMARAAVDDLSATDTYLLEEYKTDEPTDFETIEIAFTYGDKAYVKAQPKSNLDESVFDQQGASPSPSASAKPGVTNTPAPTATATAAPKQTTKPGGTTPTSAPKGTTVKDKNGSYKVTAAGAVEYAPSAAAKKKSTVKIPDTVKVNGVTYKVTSIKKKAFAKNKKLTKLTIGKYVKTIGDEAFTTCKKLKSVTFGKSVKKIGKKAFFNCKKLKTAKFLGSGAVSVGKQAFKGTPKKMKVNVKKMKKKNYKKTTKALKKGGMKSPKFTPKKAPKK